MSEKMKAIGYTRALPIDNPDSLFEFECDKPVLKQPYDLLVKVNAVSINPVDIKTRIGQKEPLKEPRILGYDAVGIVEEVGESCTRFKVGDRVFYAGSHVRPGSDAQYQLVDERIVGHAPHKLDDAHAVAMPLTSLAAWEVMFQQMDIDFYDLDFNNDKKSILIINGAGGVGSIATQLAHVARLQVIATAGTEDSKNWELQHGADLVIDYHKDIAKQLEDAGYKHVDYVLNLQDLAEYWATACQILAPEGTVGSITETEKDLDLQLLMAKSGRFAWESMFTKSLYHTPNMVTQHEILEKISIMLDEGLIESTMTKKFTGITAENLRKATALVGSHKTIGKIVVVDK